MSKTVNFLLSALVGAVVALAVVSYSRTVYRWTSIDQAIWRHEFAARNPSLNVPKATEILNLTPEERAKILRDIDMAALQVK